MKVSVPGNFARHVRGERVLHLTVTDALGIRRLNFIVGHEYGAVQVVRISGYAPAIRPVADHA
jgi:homoserine acetyltransferase